MFRRTKLSKKAMALLLSGSLVLSFTGCGGDDKPTTDNGTNTNSPSGNSNTSTAMTDFGLADKVSDGAILQAWCWDFNTIKENLADVAAAGFTGIQTCPINACVDPGGLAIKPGTNTKGVWYYHYQPTDWTIGNYQLGTKDEFKSMCEEAEKYGIKILVDVVPNHTGSKAKVLEGLANAVGGIDNLYHPNGFQNISRWGDRLQGTSYAMGGLSDVDTENDGFQDYFIKFMNDCIDCGADGFRFDTAKHIALPDDPKATDAENDFWTRVTSTEEIHNRENVFMYGEVLQGDNDRLTDYVKLLDGATASNYGNSVRGMGNNKSLDAARVLDFKTTATPDKLVTWVESHDNFVNDGTYKVLTNEEVAFAWAVIASTGQGAPLFYARPSNTDTVNWGGTVNVIGFVGDDNYKNPIVSATNHFRNAMVGEDVTPSNLDDAKKVLMIERGSKGVVILNGTEEAYNLDATVKLADGTYTDRTGLNGDFTVAGGKVTGTIAAGSVIVLYNEGFVEIPAYSVPSIEYDSDKVIGQDVELTLKCENAVSAEYTLYYEDAEGNFTQKGEPVAYTDGTKITPGNDAIGGLSFIVKVTSKNKEGVLSTMVYRYSKQDPIKAGDEIKFVSNNAWGKDIYAYIYYYDDSNNKVEVAPWPGVKMTNTEGFAYSYKFTEELKSAYVTFNDGTEEHQKPSSGEGYDVQAGKQY